MITKENYEIWMIDYLDGSLSEADQELFLQFLDENPEFKSELDGLDNLILTPQEEVLPNKASLLKTEADEMNMPYADFIAVKEIEIGLNEEEKKWKTDYLKSNKEGISLFESYKNTVLKTVGNIIFPQKGNVKRSLIIPAFTSNGFKRMSAAAAIALLISVGTLPFLRDISDNLQTAVNDTPSLIEVPKKQDIKKAQEIKSNNNASIAPVKNDSVVEKTITQKNQLLASNNDNHTEITEPAVIKEVIEPLTPNMDIKLKTNTRINAYEIALNEMMPVYIASNNVLRNAYDEPVKNEELDRYIKAESEKLSRSAWAVNNGLKIIGFITGTNSQIKKTVNDKGEMVAYEVESNSFSISQKIKSMPVTN